MKKALSILLAVMMLVGLPLTASATTTATATGALTGYPVTTYDTITPAVSVAYYAVDGVYANYFTSVDNKILGSISHDTWMAVMQPAVDSGIVSVDDNQSNWMVEQFNLYRGINFVQEAITIAAATDTDAYAQEIIRLVNEKREEVGLHALEVDDSLMAHAAIRAEEVSSNFSHVRPDGTVETSECATGVGRTPAAAFQSWMNSDPHRTAILNENGKFKYNYIGAGCYEDNSGSLYWILTFSK